MKNTKVVAIVLLVVVLLFGCSVSKEYYAENQPKKNFNQEEVFMVWDAEFFKEFSFKEIKSSIVFYNSDTIRFKGNSSFSFENGDVRLVDTLVVILPNTPCKLRSLSTSDGRGSMQMVFEKKSAYLIPFSWSVGTKSYILDNPRYNTSGPNNGPKLLWSLNQSSKEKVLLGYRGN